MYLIGSRALNCYASRNVEGKDWDFVLEDEDLKQSENCDIAPKELCTLEVCQTYDSGCTEDTPYGPAKIPTLRGLMLIKRSHLHRPLGFEKNIRDYHQIRDLTTPRSGLGPVSGETYDRLLKKLTKQTKDLYGDRVPSLKKSKTEFFDDYVTKFFEHDEIHAATCYGDRPIFEELKLEGDESVWCSKELWEKLPNFRKVQAVQEEAFVIALERFIIPNLVVDKPHRSAKMAFDKALTLICTTLTSGFFRDFAIENWPMIRDHQHDFLGLFLERKDGIKKLGLVQKSDSRKKKRESETI